MVDESLEQEAGDLEKLVEKEEKGEQNSQISSLVYGPLQPGRLKGAARGWQHQIPQLVSPGCLTCEYLMSALDGTD